MRDPRQIAFGPRFAIGIAAVVVCALVIAAAQENIGFRTSSEVTSATENVNGTVVTDLAGRQVTFAKPAERIVLVRGRDAHELVMLLGDEIEHKLVAWGPDILKADKGTYDALLKRYPKLADVPFLGSVYSDAVSVEQLLALEPDLVVVDTFMTDRGYKCVGKMQAVGLPVLFTQKGTDPIEGPRKSLAVIAKALGKEDKAREINDFVTAEMHKVLSRVSETMEGPSVYIEMGNRGVEQLGHTFGYDGKGRLVTWSPFLESLNCQNIAKGVVPHMTPLHPEQVLKANPEVIVFTGAYWDNSPSSMCLGFNISQEMAGSRLHAFTERPGWQELQAIHNGNVHALFHGFCMHPNSFAALQYLAKWCYPSLFNDLDPEASLREFNDRFMPLENSGVWSTSIDNGAEQGQRNSSLSGAFQGMSLPGSPVSQSTSK